jgi:flavin reductase (DIM6/NTAB) family NADH-FMN oxidoreductase RutF
VQGIETALNEMRTGSATRDFSAQDLREALGFFATGIAVVTAVADGGNRIGATVSSFNSVSLDPPLVLFSMARSSRAFAAWQSVVHFAVNVLSEGQDALSSKFARALGDKWEGARCLEGETGVPLLADSLAAFECARYANYDGGDHIIIVGRVCNVRVRKRADAVPLIFFRSKYRRLAGEASVEAPPDADRLLHGW